MVKRNWPTGSHTTAVLVKNKKVKTLAEAPTETAIWFIHFHAGAHTRYEWQIKHKNTCCTHANYRQLPTTLTFFVVRARNGNTAERGRNGVDELGVLRANARHETRWIWFLKEPFLWASFPGGAGGGQRIGKKGARS